MTAPGRLRPFDQIVLNDRSGQRPVFQGADQPHLQRAAQGDRHAGAGGGFGSESLAGLKWNP